MERDDNYSQLSSRSSQGTFKKTILGSKKRIRNANITTYLEPSTLSQSSGEVEILSSTSENDNGSLTEDQKDLIEEEIIPGSPPSKPSKCLEKTLRTHTNDDSFDLFLPGKYSRFCRNSGTNSNGITNNRECTEDISPENEEKTNCKQEQCPVCMDFYGDVESHLGYCTESNKVSEETLKDAFELQRKHRKERFSLGLPVGPRQMKIDAYSNKAYEKDLKKAIARSLEESHSEDWLVNVTKITTEKPAQPEVKRKGKNKFSGKPLLLRRTKEERQNIMTEKVAIVLMQSNELQQKKEEFSSSFDLRSHHLKNRHCKDSILWRKSSQSPADLQQHDFYISALSIFIKTPEEDDEIKPIKVESDRSEFEVHSTVSNC